MGALKIKGTIRISQFWPKGKSESTASKFKVTVDADAFRLQTSDGESEITNGIFFNAYVPLFRKKQKIVKRGNQITVCLRGVDAPELSYTIEGPTPTKHPETLQTLNALDYENLITEINTAKYKQPFAETACYMLLDFLEKYAIKGEVDCEIICDADTPKEACDMYGRIVGDVYILDKDKKINLNIWLLENALAFPVFYTNMPVDAIQKINKIATEVRAKGKNIYSQYRKFMGLFDTENQYSWPVNKSKLSVRLKKDKGHLLHPKIYRHWCSYNIFKNARINVGTFSQYLASVGEVYYELNDFLKGDEKANDISKLVKHKLLQQPISQVVFQKAPIELKNSQGKLIESW